MQSCYSRLLAQGDHLVEHWRVDVYLIRHADAVADARALGERLRWHDCTPTVVWTSPQPRAVETAEVVIAGVRFAGAAIAQPALAPGGDVQAVYAAIRALQPGAVVVVVGDEPGLSGLAAALVGRGDFPALRHAEAVRVSDRAVRWRFAHDDDAPRSG